MPIESYKLFVTETCDDDLPCLITDVRVTPAPESDISQTVPIQQSLMKRKLTPGEHFMDGGFVAAETVLRSQQDRQIAIVASMRRNPSWQARAGEGYGAAAFHIDWEQHRVTCPQDKINVSWSVHEDLSHHLVASIRFARDDCFSYAARQLCTCSHKQGRHLAARLQDRFELLLHQRQAEETEDWQTHYHRRAGIEGAFSQEVRCCQMRRSRYRGLAKTQIQQVASAAALNLLRLSAWFAGHTPRPTRHSALAKLARTA
jgi:transposase